VKLALGIVLALTIVIVARVLIVGIDLNGAEDQPEGQKDGSAITVAEFESVKAGRHGNSRKRLEARFGQPQTEQEIDSADVKGFGDPLPGRECIYYNWKGKESSLFQFCLDAQTQRVRSKEGLIALTIGDR
jgi:hypothetical protein